MERKEKEKEMCTNKNGRPIVDHFPLGVKHCVTFLFNFAIWQATGNGSGTGTKTETGFVCCLIKNAQAKAI